MKNRGTLEWWFTDGRTTGLGMWEGSYIDTWRAINMIPKDVVICDWHYERADLSAVYFAMKGFPVITFGYKKPEVSMQQIKDMIRFRTQTIQPTASHLLGYVHSIWDGADSFLDHYYLDEGVDITKADQLYNGMAAFRTVSAFFREMNLNSEVSISAN